MVVFKKFWTLEYHYDFQIFGLKMLKFKIYRNSPEEQPDDKRMTSSSHR